MSDSSAPERQARLPMSTIERTIRWVVFVLVLGYGVLSALGLVVAMVLDGPSFGPGGDGGQTFMFAMFRSLASLFVAALVFPARTPEEKESRRLSREIRFENLRAENERLEKELEGLRERATPSASTPSETHQATD